MGLRRRSRGTNGVMMFRGRVDVSDFGGQDEVSRRVGRSGDIPLHRAERHADYADSERRRFGLT